MSEIDEPPENPVADSAKESTERSTRTKVILIVVALVLGGLVTVGAIGALANTRSETTTATSSSAATTSRRPTTTEQLATSSVADAQHALDQLATLPVKGRAPMTGYSWDQFGNGWGDTDRNGCDTRNDMLARDLTSETFEPGNRCVVVAGTLQDPYTGTTIAFVKGNDTSTDVQIDHVVALGDAWQKGAQQLSTEERTAFANDPANLLAVDGAQNQKKGDGDAATWLPPNKPFRCTYVAKQVNVKTEYRLWVTQAEHDAIARELLGCTAIVTTTTDAPTTTVPTTSPPTTAAPLPTPAPAPAPPAASEPYYANCTAARAAGAAPLHSGEPGYRSALDRDHDGVACE